MQGIARAAAVVLVLGVSAWPGGVVSTEGFLSLDADAGDLVWDPVRGDVIASVRSSSATHSGSLLWIDPETGTVEGSLALGQDPGRLAISDDARFLYVGLESTSAFLRVNLDTRTTDLSIGIPPGSLGSNRFVKDLAVVPGAAESVVVATKRLGGDQDGIVVFDGAVQRPVGTNRNLDPIDAIRFGSDPSILYGLNTWTTEAGFRILRVDASGVAVEGVVPDCGLGRDFQVSGGLAFGVTGRVLDPAAGSVTGTFPVPQWAEALAAGGGTDPVVYFSDWTEGDGGFHAYGRDTRELSARLPLIARMKAFTVDRGVLVRWGAEGLAFRAVSSDPGTITGKIVFLRFSDFHDLAEPGNLQAASGPGSGILLSWEDNCADETGFEVERREGTGSFEPLVTAPADTVAFADWDVEPYGVYSYRVRAVRPGGPTSWSDEAESPMVAATLVLTQDGGKVRDSGRVGKDAFKVLGRIRPEPGSANAAFDPASHGVEVEFGVAEAPFRVSIPAGDPGWRTRRIRGEVGYVWATPRGSSPRITLKIVPGLESLGFAAAGLEFASHPVSPFVLAMRLGNDADGYDAGVRIRSWEEKAAGVFRPVPLR